MNIFFQHRRARLRAAMRGYRKLRSSGRLGLILSLNRSFTNTILSISPEEYDELFFLAPSRPTELIIRQYLLHKLLGKSLNEKILACIGSHKITQISIGVPYNWCNSLKAEGLPVNLLACNIRFKAKSALYACYGFVILAKAIANGLHKSTTKKSIQTHYAWFHALAELNIPANDNSKTIINWYARNWSHISKTNTLCHTLSSPKKIRVNNSKCSLLSHDPTTNCDRQSTSLSLLAWGLRSAIFVVFDLAFSTGYRSAIFPEAVKAAIVHYSRKNWRMKHAMFHNSGYIYRPLWTYEAEQIGTLISLYFYSLNCTLFLPKSMQPRLNYGWEAMNWPHYLVWNKTQADFIYKAAGNSCKVNIVGPIWFSDTKTTSGLIEHTSDFKLAAFDIQPFRSSSYQLMGLEYEYYTPKNACLFLDGLVALAECFAMTIYFKRKRHIGTIADSRYRKKIHDLEKHSSFKLIDSSFSATNLISTSNIVISMPFTSTAIIANKLGKPSAYYDPSGDLDPNDPAANELPLLTDEEKLFTWIASQIHVKI